MTRAYLGEILVQRGLLSEEKLEKALALQQEKGGRIGEVIIGMGAASPNDVYQAIADQLGIPYRPAIESNNLDPELVLNIPIQFAKTHELVPIGRKNGGIEVATSDPLNFFALDDVRKLLKAEIEPTLAPSEVVLQTINRVYDRASVTAKGVMGDLNAENLDLLAQELEEPEDLLDVSDEAPIIRLVNSLLFQAVKERASDIHIEPFEKDLVVRYRIDGVLYEILRPPKRFQNSIASRVKIMGGLNIAEKRLPQDGRIRLKIAGKDIDIRLSTVPTSHGERIVMRLLDRETVLLSVEQLGFDPAQRERFNDLIHHTHGIILVTGPTGSGKTTTLYAALNQINTPDKNIITIEDPVEYQMEGIGQIHVNPKINLTFANGLRSIVRQDPDVILVGEIRDAETAEIAIQASLTGHLVFSTLHTNDAPSSITRLVDMGIEPFLISSSLLAIIAQRLIRTLCETCKVPDQPDLKTFELLEIKDHNHAFFKPQGCPACLQTGFTGRSAVYEMLTIDDVIREMINRNADSNAIKKVARQRGMRSLREDAARKAMNGRTSLSEVVRVTQEDIL
ncbi:MAG TPA: type II secretion system ATPase GspE [bacterium]|nr:type II secretion system ATPase GspE [bacterium]